MDNRVLECRQTPNFTLHRHRPRHQVAAFTLHSSTLQLAARPPPTTSPSSESSRRLQSSALQLAARPPPTTSPSSSARPPLLIRCSHV
ncbi:hypothetical protein ACET3Z_021551 [Daucus carota]